MEPSILKNFENHILNFQKNLEKKNPDEDDVVLYQRAKYKIKIIHIPGYVKITKSNRFGIVEILHRSLH